MPLEGRKLTLECPCPGTPHEHDEVIYRAALPLAGGMAALTVIRDIALRGGEVDQLALATVLFPIYLAHAVESWTFTDAEGEPLALADADERLAFGTKFDIANTADDLFGEEVTRPLLETARRSSRAGRTAPSTSRNRSSQPRRRRQSAPSSPATSAVTGP